MSDTVHHLLDELSGKYIPAYGNLSRANIRSLERSIALRQMIIAKKIGQDTLLPSIELGIEDVGYTGICGYGYSCAYVDTISWETPTKDRKSVV